MNPYWQIAFDHLSVEELQEILEKKLQKRKLKPISQDRQIINQYKKLFQ